MDRLDVMRLFVSVVEAGSFSKAARLEGIGQPTVSKQVAALEERLSTQLLRRTSRGMSLTDAGEEFYRAALRLLDDFEAIEARITHGQTETAGRIRLAVSAGFGRLHVLPRLTRFLKRYPQIVIETDLSDRAVNMVEDRIDVAIEFDTLSDSSLITRRIGNALTGLIASRTYVSRQGEPHTLEDLGAHDVVVFALASGPTASRSRMPKRAAGVELRGRLYTSDTENIRSTVLQGTGIAQAPTWLFAHELASGEAVRVMPEIAAHHAIHAVRTGGRLVASKVRVLIEFLAQDFSLDPFLSVRELCDDEDARMPGRHSAHLLPLASMPPVSSA